jgi:hypothetical protein
MIQSDNHINCSGRNWGVYSRWIDECRSLVYWLKGDTVQLCRVAKRLLQTCTEQSHSDNLVEKNCQFSQPTHQILTAIITTISLLRYQLSQCDSTLLSDTALPPRIFFAALQTAFETATYRLHIILKPPPLTPMHSSHPSPADPPPLAAASTPTLAPTHSSTPPHNR